MQRKLKNKSLKRKRRLIFKRIRFLVIVLIVLFIGFKCRSLITGDGPIKMTALVQEDPAKQNVAVMKDNVDSQKYQPLKTELENYLKSFEGEYGIYYYNLVSNESFGINQKDEFTAASTLKVPLNLYLYNRIKDGEINPLEELTYLEQDYEEGTGKIQYEDIGSKYCIKELSRLSIVSSDNVATNMLFRKVGLSNVKGYMRQLGGTVVVEGKNISCPLDMGLYMRCVYDLYTSDKVLGNELMDNLFNTEFNDRLPALLPQNIKVAHKIGSQVQVVNDVGIVFADKPYIIAVMSKNINEAEAPEVIANISKKIFEFVNSNK